MEWIYEKGPLPCMETYTYDMGILGNATLMSASNERMEVTAWVLHLNGQQIARFPIGTVKEHGELLINAENAIIRTFTRELASLFCPHDCETDA